MSRRKTHEEYIAELSVKNPTVEVVGKYDGALTKITHRCLIHDINWDTTPSRALQGVGCEMCHGERIASVKFKTNEQYIKEVNNINPHIIVIEKYIDAKTPILHKCNIHNVEWKALPDNVLHGHGCYRCGNEKSANTRSKCHEQYVSELKEINENILVIGDYLNALTPILHKCMKDGYEWDLRPANALLGQGCPKCRDSRGERQIRQWLDNHNILYESQKIFDDCKDIKPLPFDFYLPNYNICVEFDGEQHYKPIEYFGGKKMFELRVKHDNIKNGYCQRNNIELLRIPYYEDVEEKLNNFLFI